MTETRHKRVYHKLHSYSSRESAEAKAALYRREGKQVRVRRDPISGKYLVEILSLVVIGGLALGLLGGLRR